MRLVLSALALAGLSASAFAQAPPPGSFQESCREFGMQGSTLSALCRSADGREQWTALNVSRCVGDIGNDNGNLVCNGGQPAGPLTPPPPSPAQAYPGPPGPGYPAPGYGPPPRYGADSPYRERCAGLRHEEHEVRDRLAYAPYGEERERLQYRLGQLRAESERCRHR